jgi:hypothetical protein
MFLWIFLLSRCFSTIALDSLPNVNAYLSQSVIKQSMSIVPHSSCMSTFHSPINWVN